LQVPEASWNAGLALQAVAALGLAAQQEAGMLEGDGEASSVVKRLALEARWAASSSRKELMLQISQGCAADASGSMAFACLLLGQAELLRGKTDKGKEALKMVSAMNYTLLVCLY
jgi:hypothetical protein